MNVIKIIRVMMDGRMLANGNGRVPKVMVMRLEEGGIQGEEQSVQTPIRRVYVQQL
jgi:hypothetical protein